MDKALWVASISAILCIGTLFIVPSGYWLIPTILGAIAIISAIIGVRQ